MPQGLTFDPIPVPLYRKYIGYAQKYVHPHLSQEAADMLQVCVGSGRGGGGREMVAEMGTIIM